MAAVLMTRPTSKRMRSFDEPLHAPSPMSHPIPAVPQPPLLPLSDYLEVWLWTAHAYLSQGPEEHRGVHQRLAWYLPAPTTDYDLIMSTLRPIFAPTEPLSAIRDRFTLLKQQHGESLDSFLGSLMTMARHLFPQDQRERHVLDRLIHGVTDWHTWHAFRTKEPVSIAEALETARRFNSAEAPGPPPIYDTMVAGIRTTTRPPISQPSADGSPCWFCQKFGKKARKCGHNPGNTVCFTHAVSVPGSTPTKPLVTQGTVNSRRTSLLIDTGAGISLINATFARKAKLQLQPHIPSITVLSANNSPIPIRGHASATISVGESVVEHTFLVTPSIKWNVILDTDFLHQHSCDIHFDLGTASITLEPASQTVDVDTISLIPPAEPTRLTEKGREFKWT